MRKIYCVLPDDDVAGEREVRSVDESGEDYLYPITYFSPIDVSEELQEALLTVS